MNKYLYIFIILLPIISFSQSFDLLQNYVVGNRIVFDYTYDEFNKYFPSDSTIVLTSFSGQKTVSVDSMKNMSDSTVYFLSIETNGIEIKKNNHGTISTSQISKLDSLTILMSDSSNYWLKGWIFPDSISESVACPNDTTHLYPYHAIYRYYLMPVLDSLYIVADTLDIIVRPALVNNCLDMFFELRYKAAKDNGLIFYRREQNYYQTGFIEEYRQQSVLGIKSDKIIPSTSLLLGNFPNPFNGYTKIRFQIPKSGNVKLSLYDIQGKFLLDIFKGYLQKGEYIKKINFSGLSSGIYLISLHIQNLQVTKKCLLLK